MCYPPGLGFNPPVPEHGAAEAAAALKIASAKYAYIISIYTYYILYLYSIYISYNRGKNEKNIYAMSMCT